MTVPAFSSLPGADHTIYLDFDGQSVTGTSWNNYYNQTTLNANPYDIDGNPSTFSSTELARIEEAWKRTAEDFRPFNVNVTTVDPGTEALRKSGTGDTQWGVRVLVTKESTMVTDPNEYCGCGGIAYIDSFNWSSDTPVWVYTSGGKSIAEAASHEVGHSLGLSHDGLISGTTYYGGHGDGDTGWASIMGVGYYENVTQWDKGEFYDANNGGSGANYGDGPDDLALIVGTVGPGNGFGYRADDHGDSNVTASALGLSGTTVSDSGIVETTNDVDVFSFTTGAGLVTLNIDPFTPGPNLDIKADLYNGSGNLIASSNSSSVLDAGFSQTLAAGQYFLHVDGTGWGTPGANSPSGYSDYASLGQYTISGSIVDPGALPAVSINNVSAAESDSSLSFTLTLSAAAATDTFVDWATDDGSATAGEDYIAAGGTATILAGHTTANVTVTLTDDSVYEGDEAFAVNLTNPNGLTIGDSQGVGTILEDDPAPLPTISIADASVNEGKFQTKGKNKNTAQLTDMVFTVALSAASTQTVTVAFATSDDTATLGNNDYQSNSGTVTFLPGDTTQTISVTIFGDNDQEPDETFTVKLSNPSNADLGDAAATGTILDDDSGGGGGGGGGKGGGKPNKSPSEVDPIAVADPIWFFEEIEGLQEHDHLYEHDHLHDGQPDWIEHRLPAIPQTQIDGLAANSVSGTLIEATKTSDSAISSIDIAVADNAFVNQLTAQETPEHVVSRMARDLDARGQDDELLADLIDALLDDFSDPI